MANTENSTLFKNNQESKYEEVYHQLLENPMLLKKIFQHLSLGSLKLLRQVSNLWSNIAAELFSNRIWILLSPPFSDLEVLASFICRYRINHGLCLSLCTPPWMTQLVTRNEELKQYKEHIQLEMVSKYLNITGKHVIHLILQHYYVVDNDAAYLRQLLNSLDSCQKLELKMVVCSEDAIKSTEFNFIPKSVKTFSIDVQEVHEKTQLSVDGCQRIMRCCSNSNIQLIDFIGYDCGYRSSSGTNVEKNCLQALSEICRENQDAFKDLSDLRTGIFSLINVEAIQGFPRPLREVHLHVAQPYKKDHALILHPSHLHPIFSSHAQSLEVLDFEWSPDPVRPFTISRFQIPITLPSMKKLRRLDFTNSAGRLSWANGWIEAKLDILNIRTLLLDKDFESKFPSLTTLSVFFFKEDETTIWEWILPQESIQRRIPQITTLNVNLVDECDSELVKLIYVKFPNLSTFRHTRRSEEHDNAIVACEHMGEHYRSVRNDWLFHYKLLGDHPIMTEDGYVDQRLRYQLGGGGEFETRCNLPTDRYYILPHPDYDSGDELY